jgi:hypothetical protein
MKLNSNGRPNRTPDDLLRALSDIKKVLRGLRSSLEVSGTRLKGRSIPYSTVWNNIKYGM